MFDYWKIQVSNIIKVNLNDTKYKGINVKLCTELLCKDFNHIKNWICLKNIILLCFHVWISVFHLLRPKMLKNFNCKILLLGNLNNLWAFLWLCNVENLKKTCTWLHIQILQLVLFLCLTLSISITISHHKSPSCLENSKSKCSQIKESWFNQNFTFWKTLIKCT